MSTVFLSRWLPSALGPVQIVIEVATNNNPTPDLDSASLCRVEFVAESELIDGQNRADHPLLDLVESQLSEYFSQQRTDFSALYRFIGGFGTAFQRQVWQALTTIPFGATCSYQQIAAQIGNDKAVRAVGAANGKNPLAIIVPCHRVIGANGTLTGYAGGLDKKQWLLDFEQALPEQTALF